MSTGTVRFHRVLRAPPARLFRAFTNADALAKWLPPHGFVGHVHEMDARTGGRFRMSFTNLTTGDSQSFGGEYLEVLPDASLRYTDRFDDPGLPGTMVTSVTFKPVSVGTELHIVQEGIPPAIPVEMCYLGWQESLQLLTLLVEPELKAGA